MPSGLQQFSDVKFSGGGSKTISIRYIIMVASITGEATGDEQCLAIADGLSRLTGSSRPAANGRDPMGGLDAGVSPGSSAPSGGPGQPTMAPGGLVGI